MIDWKLLPYFLAAARTGSLRGAAEELGATHATVRRHIETLEGSYGVQLFRRARDGLSLTAAGKTLLPRALEAEAIVIQGRNAVQGLDREASGLIRLSLDPMTGHLLLAPALARFGMLYPEIELEISLTYDIESVSGLEADVTIRHAAEITEDVTARRLFPMSLGTFASRDYIDEALSDAGPKGEGLSWLGYGPTPELREMIAASSFPKARVRHTVRDPEMHLHLVRAGAGMTFLPLWVQDRFPELQRVPGTGLSTGRFTWIVLHSDLRRTARVRIFVDFLAAELLERRARMIEN